MRAGEWLQAFRSLHRTPWYTATVITVTALTMALASTVFAVVDGVLFRPLPYPTPDELYVVSGRHADDIGPPTLGVGLVSPNEVSEWSAAAPGVRLTNLGYTSIGFPDGSAVPAVAVDSNFIEIFGIRLLMGGFEPDDFVSEQPVLPVIISHRVWQERFDGDPSVVGRVIKPFYSSSQVSRVVGVMASDVFIPPLPTGSASASRLSRRIGALRPPFRQALSERSSVAFARIPTARLLDVRGILAASVEAFRDVAPLPRPGLPEEYRRRSRAYDRVDLLPLRDYVAARERPVFAAAFGMAMSLVVLVVLNAAGLAAARVQQRVRDLSLRRALGARTSDLLRNALVEQTVLVVAGALLGLLAAPMLLALVLDRLPPGLNLVKEVRLDWRVLSFAGFVSIAAAWMVALHSVRVTVRSTAFGTGFLYAHGRTSARGRLGLVLVAGQTAVAFALVLGGALFGTSLVKLWTQDPGFRVRDVATMMLRYSEGSPNRTRALALVQPLRDMPGVRGVALLDTSLMSTAGSPEGVFAVPPSAAAPRVVRPTAVSVSSGFFEAAGVKLREGRLPTDIELDAGAPVVAVTETLARMYWPTHTAIGEVLSASRGTQRADCVVVGVVQDVRLVALDLPPEPVVFSPWLLPVRTYGATNLFVSTDSDSPGALRQVLERLTALDPTVLVTDVRWLEHAMADSIRERRLGALAASVYGGVALGFIALGLAGLVSSTSSVRTREMGIRLALGATPGGLVRLIVGGHLGAVVAGLLAGALITSAMVPLVSARLYGVGAYDLGSWFATAAVMLFTALLSSLAPALRAVRVGLVESLRQG